MGAFSGSSGWLEGGWVWKQPERAQSSDHSNFVCLCAMLRNLGLILKPTGKWKNVKGKGHDQIYILEIIVCGQTQCKGWIKQLCDWV